jgi:hypothetical protein
MQQLDNTTAIWTFQRALSRRLLAWAMASSALGLVLAWRGNAFWRGVGVQAIAWGAVDGAIAVVGQYGAEKQQGSALPVDDLAQARRLRRLLRLNAALDVLYVAGGLFIVERNVRSNRHRAGHGAGIVLQGAFLFVFDWYHARRVPRFRS